MAVEDMYPVVEIRMFLVEITGQLRLDDVVGQL
jgi:hypothetical protein